MTTKAPFHYGLFYSAMIGLIGREPDGRNCAGSKGFYDFTYTPTSDRDRKDLEKAAGVLATWLDVFDITFSGSRCEFGIDPIRRGESPVLNIRITHPVASNP